MFKKQLSISENKQGEKDIFLFTIFLIKNSKHKEKKTSLQLLSTRKKSVLPNQRVYSFLSNYYPDLLYYIYKL